MVRLMQKERLKSPQKSLIIEPGLWVILSKTAIWVILVSHFRAGADTPTKSPNWGLAQINLTEPHTAVVLSDPQLRRDKIRVLGVSREMAPNPNRGKFTSELKPAYPNCPSATLPRVDRPVF